MNIGFRFKVISIIFLFFIILIISFYIFFHNYIFNEMLSAEEDKINIYTSTIVSNLDKDIKNLKEYMRFIASLEGIKIKERNKLDKILLYYNEYNPLVHQFFIINANGLIVSSPKREELIGLNVFENFDFNITQIEDNGFIKSAYLNNNFSIIVYMPIIDENGKLINIIAGFLNLEKENLQIYDSLDLPYFYEWKILLVDKKGMLIYHSHQKAKKLNLEERDYSNYVSVNNALRGYWGLKHVKIDNLKYYSSSEVIPESDWIIVVEIPQFIVIDKVNKILRIQTLFIIIFFVILFVILILFIDKIIKPLEYLTAALNNYGEEKSFKLLTVKGKDEVSRAINAFNYMVKEGNNFESEIIATSEKERRRIGLDLHDDLGQILTGIAFQSMILEGDLKNKSEINNIKKISNLTSKAINKVKMLAKGLYPITLKENGLIYAVEEFINSIIKIYKIKCKFKGENIIINDENVALNLFHIIQEAVNNSVKHGNPTQIDILLNKTNDDIVVKIIDNGIGFQQENNKGMGLKIMKYRARLINAELNISSKKNEGTTIICRKKIISS